MEYLNHNESIRFSFDASIKLNWIDSEESNTHHIVPVYASPGLVPVPYPPYVCIFLLPGLVPVPYIPYVCTFNCTVLFHSHSHDQNITIFLRSHHPSSTTPCPFPLRATPFPSPLCPLPPSYVTVAKVGIYLSLACWSFYI